MKVIIPSSGLSTRLNPLTNEIPKILVNIGNHTSLKMLYEYWNQYEDLEHIIIIIHERFFNIVKSYIKKYNLKKIKIKIDNTSDGSYKTLVDFIEKNKKYRKNVIFNWCDVIPKSKIEIPNKNTIFTYKETGRYYAKGSFIEKKDNGNVVGIYYAKELNEDFFKFPKNEFLDFVDCFKFEQTIEIEDCIDYGDFKKLEYENSKLQICREFNEVYSKDDYFIKNPINDYGIKLFELEKKWYLKNKNCDKIAKLLNIDSINENKFLKLEKITGNELKNIEKIDFNFLIKEIKEFHNLFNLEITNEQKNKDLYIEIVEKSLIRYKKINSYLKSFGKIKYINGIEIFDNKYIFKKIFEIIKKINIENKYVNFHGDLHFSNIFLTENNEIKFIDPRGYFGSTELFGLENYDFAKVIYSYSGYDNFNDNNNFKYNKIGENLSIEIDPKNQNYLELLNNFDDFNTKLEIKLWLAIIWTNLGGYLENNPIKAIISYYYGLYLSTIFIKEYENKNKIK